jgi:hypothetical protein
MRTVVIHPSHRVGDETQGEATQSLPAIQLHSVKNLADNSFQRRGELRRLVGAVPMLNNLHRQAEIDRTWLNRCLSENQFPLLLGEGAVLLEKDGLHDCPNVVGRLGNLKTDHIIPPECFQSKEMILMLGHHLWGSWSLTRGRQRGDRYNDPRVTVKSEMGQKFEPSLQRVDAVQEDDHGMMLQEIVQDLPIRRRLGEASGSWSQEVLDLEPQAANHRSAVETVFTCPTETEEDRTRGSP